MASKKNTTVTTETNPFANVPEFRAKGEEEARNEYAKALFAHVNEHAPGQEPGLIFRTFYPQAGYKSQGGMYAAINGASGNGNGTARTPRAPKTREALAEKIATAETKIAELTAAVGEMKSELENWDTIHAEDTKKAEERRAKDMDRVKNTLSELSPEQRLQLLKDLGVINATMQQNDPQ